MKRRVRTILAIVSFVLCAICADISKFVDWGKPDAVETVCWLVGLAALFAIYPLVFVFQLAARASQSQIHKDSK